MQFGCWHPLLTRVFLLACLLASPAALGQTYPDRNVTIVVTSAAGALTDVLTRAVAQRLSEMWKQSVIVENRGGAGYSIAAQSVMRAEHDGYTLLASETGFYTTQPHLYAKDKLPYAVEKDFVPVAGYGTIPTALLVNPSVPVNSVSDLIALAKMKPGAVTFGTAGVGTALHIAGLELENLAGIKMTAVHYRGAAPALTDVIAGHVNAVIMGPSVALSSVKDGKLKMLAFGSEKRVPQFRRADHRRYRCGIRGERIVRAVYRGGHAYGHHQEGQRRRAKDRQRSQIPEEVSRTLCGAAGTWRARRLCRIFTQGFGQMGRGHPYGAR